MDSKMPYPEAPPRYGDIGFTSAQVSGPETHFMTPVTIVAHTAPPNILGPGPSMATCPSCRDRGMTKVEYEANSKTHLIALLMCLLGCVCCFCIPYCTSSCQTAVHTCNSCGAFIGSYKN